MAVLNKKLLRDIWKARGQTAAVALIILCGTATYIAINSAYRNLLLTRDTYYQEYRFADFEIQADRAPGTAVFKIESLPGVREVRGRIVEEANVDIPGVDRSRTGRIISMPVQDDRVLNDIHMMEGRYFEPGVINEVVLSQRFAEANGLGVGDSIKASIDNKKHTLKIVGLALSPEYVYLIRNVQELVPSPERFGILWVPEDFAETAFDMDGAVNNFIGTVENEDELDRILDEADQLLDAYGVFAKTKKENQISNRFVSDEIAGLGVMAKIMPTIFLGIAALIILVLLSRMVRKERTEIGLLKAYGYSNWTVAFHYIKYAMVMAAAGCIGGFAVGQWLANGMIQIYVQFYQFPVLRSRVYPDVLAQSMGIAMVFAVLGAAIAARRAALIHPAESMRPEAPKFGSRTILERVHALWKRLSFTWKMIARNIARNPLRAGFGVFGVMVSCGLVVMGFFAGNAIDYLIRFQFYEIQREDMTVNFVREFGKGALHEFQRYDNVRRAEPMLQYPFTIKNGWREKDIVVTGVPADSELQYVLDTDKRRVDLDHRGLVLPQHLANELQVRPGSTVRLEPLMGRIEKERDVTVSNVTEQYLGTSAYMNIDALSRVLDESFAMNAMLVQAGGDDGAAKLNNFLKDVASVAAVAIKQDMLQSLEDTIATSMKIQNTVMLFFAGAISFAIIYNVTMVSLAERERELASLRVLGFTNQEVGRILYRENFILAALGIILGLPFGAAICRLMVYAYDTDLYRLPFYIPMRTYVIAVGASAVFVILANLAVRRRIRTLDMVEVLKSRE